MFVVEELGEKPSIFVLNLDKAEIINGNNLTELASLMNIALDSTAQQNRLSYKWYCPIGTRELTYYMI